MKNMFTTNENNIRKTTHHAATIADLIQHIKEAEAKQDQLETRNKELMNQLTIEKLARKKAEEDSANNQHLLNMYIKGVRYEKDLLEERDKKIVDLESQLVEANTICNIRGRRIAGLIQKNNKLEKEINLLKQLAKDLFARLKSWQQIAKNQFRKNKELEIEAICKECEVDEAYNRIRELENQLAEKDWIIQQQKDHLDAYKMWEELTTMGSILQVVTEIAGYEMESAFIEDWNDCPIDYEIKRLDLRDEILRGLGYIATEAAELESKLRVEITLEELEDSNF